MKAIRQIGFFPFCESRHDRRSVSGFSLNMGSRMTASYAAGTMSKARSVAAHTNVFSLAFGRGRAAWSRKYVR